jgi:N-acetylneuraminic acid mutarotase
MSWDVPMISGIPPKDRAKHDACLVGKDIYVFGGASNEQTFDDLYILDTWEMSWSKVTSDGWVPEKRVGHSLTIVGAKLWVFAGADANDRTKEDLYFVDLQAATMRWDMKSRVSGIVPIARCGHSTGTVGSKLFIVGGSENGRVRKDVCVLDTATDIWSQPVPKGDEPESLVFHSMVAVGNRLFIFGGGDGRRASDKLYIYDTVKHNWSLGKHEGKIPQARAGHSMCTLNSSIYLFGGYAGSVGFLSDVYKLDADTLRWESQKPIGDKLPDGRLQHSMVLFDQRMLIFGGTGNKVVFNDLWTWNCPRRLFELHQPAGTSPEARFGHSAVMTKNKMMVFGGGTRVKHFNDLQILEGPEGPVAIDETPVYKWTKPRIEGSPPGVRSRTSVTLVGKSLYVFLASLSPQLRPLLPPYRLPTMSLSVICSAAQTAPPTSTTSTSSTTCRT